MAGWKLMPEWSDWLSVLAWVLDARVQPRIAPLIVGALFAQLRARFAATCRDCPHA